MIELINPAHITDLSIGTYDGLPDKFLYHTFFGDKGYSGFDFYTDLKFEKGIMMLPLKKTMTKHNLLKNSGS